MPYSGKRKYPYRLTLYIPPEKEKIVKEMVEAFRARNESLSQKFLDWVQNYDRTAVFSQSELEEMLTAETELIHRKMKEKLGTVGRINPQTRLSNHLEKERSKPYVAPKQCRFQGCNKPVVNIVVSQKGSEYTVCEYHRRRCLESGKWKEKRG